MRNDGSRTAVNAAQQSPHPGADTAPGSARQGAASDGTEEKKQREAARTKLTERLLREGAPDLASPLQKCGEPLKLVCTCCGSLKTAEIHCLKRYCPACTPIVTAQRLAKWAKPISQMTWPLFVTLTIPNSLDPESLTRLKKGWQKFRRRKLIREKVAGGVATYEVTNKGKGWHPHIHAIMDCRWLSIHVPEPHWRDSKATKEEKCACAQQELADQWADCMGEEMAHVWVTRTSGVDAVHEVLKYAVKSSDLLDSPDPISPMLYVLKNTRTLAGWGSFFPLPSPDEEEKPEARCEDCGMPADYIPEEVLKYMMR